MEMRVCRFELVWIGVENVEILNGVDVPYGLCGCKQRPFFFGIGVESVGGRIDTAESFQEFVMVRRGEGMRSRVRRIDEGERDEGLRDLMERRRRGLMGRNWRNDVRERRSMGGVDEFVKLRMRSENECLS
ncbi:hypothetical protein Tco_0891191 [Tanacetum coccineum]|uniref:Uncharacterized protein n=1 Tax=Tanacetum coccineum TaxID=301880 RepID=A0ABQ5C7P5_9ASTR